MQLKSRHVREWGTGSGGKQESGGGTPHEPEAGQRPALSLWQRPQVFNTDEKRWESVRGMKPVTMRQRISC